MLLADSKLPCITESAPLELGVGVRQIGRDQLAELISDTDELWISTQA